MDASNEHHSRNGWPGAARLTLGLLGVCGAAFYLVQGIRSAPNHVDEGLLLGYLQVLADGGRPYRDFVDVYGLLSWPLPSLAFRLAGEQVWGVRIYVWLIKLACVCACYGVVRRLSDARAALLAALWMTLWLGLRWQLLQAPYAFMPALLLSLAVWLCLLRGPFAAPRLNRLLAAVLTGCVLCVKLNSGAFLLAGAAMHTFYLRRTPADGSSREGEQRAVQPLSGWGVLQLLGLLLVAVLFGLFIREHFQPAYALYLVWPLALGLWIAWTERVSAEQVPRRVLETAELILVALLTGFVVLASFVGPAGVPRYLGDTIALIGRLEYASALPPIGQPGRYVGFNEHGWMQLPWLITLVAQLAVARARRAGRVPPELTGAVVLYAFNLFALYSRSDESHVHQASLLGIPTLFVAFHALQQAQPARSTSWRIAHAAPLALSLFALISLGARPTLTSPWATAGDFHAAALRFLDYRSADDPHVRPLSAELDDRSWDEAFDYTASVVDALTERGEPVLLLSRDELVLFAAQVNPVGGRYRYLYYLVRNAHLDRAGFDALAPPGLLPDLLTHPPRVIVTAYGANELLDAFPEIRALRDENYVMYAKFQLYLVYVHRGAQL